MTESFPEPNTENVVYIDEYPELKKKVWLRRLAVSRQMGQVVSLQNVLIFERNQDASTQMPE